MITLEEIKKQQEKLDEMIKAYEEQKEKLSTVWIPQDDEIFFFIHNNGDFIKDSWDGSDCDTDRLYINNVFKTEEEAQAQIEFLKILYELRTCGGDYWHNIKKKTEDCYVITYEHRSNEIRTNHYCRWLNDLPLPVYFATQEQTEKAVITIGEDRLRKYWFRVEG